MGLFGAPAPRGGLAAMETSCCACGASFVSEGVGEKGGLDSLGQETLHWGFRRVLSNDQCRFLMEDSFIWVPVGEPGFPSLKI